MPETECPKPGIYFDVPFDVYSAWLAFRKSDASDLLRSPMHWLWTQNHRKQTPAMTMGSMIDSLVCESQAEFDAQFAVRPDTYKSEVTKGRGEAKATTTIEKPWTMNSNTCKGIAEKLRASGMAIVSTGDVLTAKGAAAALKAHPLMAQWLKVGRTQVSMVWVDAKTGVLCKGRMDLLVNESDLLIVDLKGTVDADRGPFRRTMTNFKYHIQGGLYQDGFASLTGGLYPAFYLAAVEMGGPHGCAVYPIGPDSLGTGLVEARKAMLVWREIQRTGKYLGYPVVQEELDILPYAIDFDIRAVGMGG